MNIFLNEVSLHGQYLNDGDFENALRALNSVLDRVDQAEVEKYVFYSTSWYFSHAVGANVFAASLEAVREKSIRTLFKRLVRDRLRSTDWLPVRMHLNCSYVWNEVEVAETSVAELAERSIRGQNGFLISMNPSKFSEVKPILIQKECGAIATLFSVASEMELEEWYGRNPILGLIGYPLNVDRPPTDVETVLANRTRFRRTIKRNQGRVVYQERSTGRQYCVDNLHHSAAAHLEVFDAAGRHIGEASTTGVLDMSKADALKTLEM